jgi:hypothetical protein
MRVNPGGYIEPKEVIGRDALIRNIWETLDRQSAVITAERRIGKTCVIKKMHAESPAEWFPVFQDLERIHSAAEFAQEVFETVQSFLGRWKQAADRAKQFLEGRDVKIGGVEIGGRRERPWKTLLIHSIADLVDAKTDQRLVFFWDEVPYMLDRIRRREDEDSAAEILDTLRSLRQTHAAFRMVFTGSIGLHHVLARLKEADYGNEPTNDMAKIDVPPLTSEDAQELARRLIEGEQLFCADPAAAVEAIAREADCVPFYIHHLVRQLKRSQRPLTPEHIAALVQEQLVDANNPWELAHYRDRIRDYYPQADDGQLVQRVLDELSVTAKPQSVASLLRAFKSATGFADRDRLLRILRLMERDHYLARTPQGLYAFRFPLIRRWWKLDRGL